MYKNQMHAVLVLADGQHFIGRGFGSMQQVSGEVVFNTAMSGYQEIITDPSYLRQIVVFTAPQIGNTGVNTEDIEHSHICIEGMIVRDLPHHTSNFRCRQSLHDYLQTQNKPGIFGIDTRRLTRILCEQGAQHGCLDVFAANEDVATHIAAAHQQAMDFPGLEHMDLARHAGTGKADYWREGDWSLGKGYTIPSVFCGLKVVVYDFGVKNNILRIMRNLGCAVFVVPPQYPVADVIAMQPHGVLLANGPGDPAACTYAIDATRDLLMAGIPIMGICLGHQILALACGARVEKMKFGHHGANHPVQEIASGKVMITSQNHGFAVTEKDFPEDLTITHRSLFDHSIQGFRHRSQAALGFQGHPEASPGPHDMRSLFWDFNKMMSDYQDKLCFMNPKREKPDQAG